MKNYAIIVAGGRGERMGLKKPKQFIEINKNPILLLTLKLFEKINNCEIILVLPKDQIDYWNKICKKHNVSIKHQIAEGGETRYHSVKNGLMACKNYNNDSVVAIHDGVRPFVNKNVIKKGFETAYKTGSAVPFVNINETIRKIETKKSYTVPRDNYCIAQTPQFFNLSLIKKSYNKPYSKNFTDDASVFEKHIDNITLIEGNEENIKITQKIDLKYAEIFYTDFYEN